MKNLKIRRIETFFFSINTKTHLNTTHTVAHNKTVSSFSTTFFRKKKQQQPREKETIFFLHSERKTDLNMCCAAFFFFAHSFLFRLRSLHSFAVTFAAADDVDDDVVVVVVLLFGYKCVLRLFNRFLFQNDSNCSRYTTRLQSTVHVRSDWSECE